MGERQSTACILRRNNVINGKTFTEKFQVKIESLHLVQC